MAAKIQQEPARGTYQHFKGAFYEVLGIAEDPETILRLFTHASSYVAGRHVTVDQPGGVITGTTAGLDPAGFLIVRQDDGTDTLILAGGVRAAGS